MQLNEFLTVKGKNSFLLLAQCKKGHILIISPKTTLRKRIEILQEHMEKIDIK